MAKRKVRTEKESEHARERYREQWKITLNFAYSLNRFDIRACEPTQATALNDKKFSCYRPQSNFDAIVAVFGHVSTFVEKTVSHRIHWQNSNSLQRQMTKAHQQHMNNGMEQKYAMSCCTTHKRKKCIFNANANETTYIHTHSHIAFSRKSKIEFIFGSFFFIFRVENFSSNASDVCYRVNPLICITEPKNLSSCLDDFSN